MVIDDTSIVNYTEYAKSLRLMSCRSRKNMKSESASAVLSQIQCFPSSSVL